VNAICTECTASNEINLFYDARIFDFVQNLMSLRRMLLMIFIHCLRNACRNVTVFLFTHVFHLIYMTKNQTVLYKFLLLAHYS
jgi:hypothetical protein